MTLTEFQKMVEEGKVDKSMSPYLKSLYFDARGDWNKSHEIIQDIDDSNAAWIHAYLHRKEGDISNADYWYRRAGRKRKDISLEEEWNDLVGAMTD